MAAEQLPGWAIDDDASVRREVAPYVEATMLERWIATRKCCRGAARIVQFNVAPSQVWAARDPLSAESELALKQLRAEFQKSQP